MFAPSYFKIFHPFQTLYASFIMKARYLICKSYSLTKISKFRSEKSLHIYWMKYGICHNPNDGGMTMTICELVLLWSFLSHPFLRKSEPMKCLFVCMQPRQSVGVKTRGSVGLIFNLTAVHCAAQALLAGRADCK